MYDTNMPKPDRVTFGNGRDGTWNCSDVKPTSFTGASKVSIKEEKLEEKTINKVTYG